MQHNLKLDQVLENTRDAYMINILEEGTSELESLKTKKFLNENLSFIRKILVEENVIRGVQNHLKNNWGKYAGAGLAAAGATGGVAAHGAAIEAENQFQDNKGLGQKIGEFTGYSDKTHLGGQELAKATLGQMVSNPGQSLATGANSAGHAIQGAANSAGQAVQGAANDVGHAVQGAANSAGQAVQGAYHNAGQAVQGAYHNATNAIQGAANDAGTWANKHLISGK